jgi:hypothetical protein
MQRRDLDDGKNSRWRFKLSSDKIVASNQYHIILHSSDEELSI